ncbi:hypothetical protein JCM3770_005023 [Rhodotorula araucariae]
MPTSATDEPSVSKFVLERLAVSFALDLRCNLAPEDEAVREKGVNAPLPVSCKLLVQRVRNQVKVTFALDSRKFGAISPCADVGVHLYYRTGSDDTGPIFSAQWLHRAVPDRSDNGEIVARYSLYLDKDAFRAAEQASSGEYSQSTHRRYRLKVAIEHIEPPAPDGGAFVGRVQRNPDTTHTPIPHDVRLFFPFVGEAGAELWTTSHLLSYSSSYLKDFLASDFAESVKIGSKRARTSKTPDPITEERPPKDFDDSDDEADAALFKKKPPALHDLAGLDFTYRQITITQAAYSTYRAVLRYLETDYIRFAPLSSLSAPEAEAPRDDLNDNLPPCVSPKSVYRLAHLLRLKELQEACLFKLCTALTHTNAAHELFDSASVLYDEWREVILDFVVNHFDDVSKTQSWIDMMERVERDEVPGAAGILVKLVRAQAA